MFGRIDATGIAIVLTASIAAVTDMVWGRIFNSIVVTAAIIGLSLSALDSGWSGLNSAGAGALLGFALYGWMFLIGFMGGGDVKLLMALGVLGGPKFVLEVAILAILLGGVMSIVILAFKGRLIPFFHKIHHFLLTIVVKDLEFLPPQLDRSLTMPFGVPMALAAVLVHFFHPLRGFFL